MLVLGECPQTKLYIFPEWFSRENYVTETWPKLRVVSVRISLYVGILLLLVWYSGFWRAEDYEKTVLMYFFFDSLLFERITRGIPRPAAFIERGGCSM